MTSVAVDGVDVIVHSESGRKQQPLSTLAAAGTYVGIEPDVAWAAELDIPTPGLLDADLNLVADDAAALAAWFGFGWKILDQLSTDADSKHASEPQLWPEHFDAAIEIGAPAGKTRASDGFSPGDVSLRPAQPTKTWQTSPRLSTACSLPAIR